MIPQVHPPCHRAVLHPPHGEIAPEVVEVLDLSTNLGEEVQSGDYPGDLAR
jgi:hypothetical protein